jgi:hypothetical protein
MAVNQSILKGLKNNDPKARRKAIVDLTNSRDKDAIKMLEDIAQNDSEQKLRELASKAVGHLKEQMERAAAPRPAASDEYEVSESDEARARSYMDEAMSVYIAKDNAKATRALIKALKANPNLKSDSYFLSLVGNVFNTSGDVGIEMLRSAEKRGEFIQSAEKERIQRNRDVHYSQAAEIGWSSAVFDLVVYGVVIALLTFLTPYVTIQMMNQTLTYQTALKPEKLKEEPIKIPAKWAKFSADFQKAGPLPLIGAAAGAGVGSAISMLLLAGIIHLVATKVLRGNGTMPFMMSKLVPFYSLMIPVFTIWAYIVMGMIAIGAGLIGLLCVPLMALGSFVVFFKAAGRIGGAYDFGAAKGCISLVMGSFALWLVSSAISYALVGSAFTTLTSTLR